MNDGSEMSPGTARMVEVGERVWRVDWTDWREVGLMSVMIRFGRPDWMKARATAAPIPAIHQLLMFISSPSCVPVSF